LRERRREVEDLSHSDQGAIARLATWLTALHAEDFPQRAIERAKLLLLDTLGCGFAALDDDGARAVLATLDALGEKPQCTVLGHARGMSAPSAVLANGTLIRVLDLNDYVSAHTRKAAPAAATRATIFRSRLPPPRWPHRPDAISSRQSCSRTKSTAAAKR
jgi:hypothetical protein